jgi:predicted SprT family Zn-dependent metalloprotease
MLRLKSASKPARGPARPDFDFTDDASAASDATRDARVAAATSAASSAALARAPSFPKSALKKPRETVFRTEAEAGEDSPARRPSRRAAARASAVASAREKALTWLDDEASADGDESDDEASADDGDESDDDFVVGDDEVEYASDASEAAIADDIRARSGGIMPNADAVRDRPRGARAERGVTFVSPSAAIDPVELSGDEAERAETRGPRALKEANAEPADPYCLDGLRTPTPPRALLANPYNPKTPKSAIGRKPGGGAYAGFGEAPPTHSKALAAALASAAKPGKRLNFARHKETVATELYREFNRDGFGGALPERFEITWNAKLLTTAGLTHYRKVTRSSGVSEYHARIELSTKVLDTAEKLEATLLHEMCHAAAWLLDHCAKPPHGSVFKKWAERAMRAYPVVRVDTCHSYQIHQPYKYRCTQSWCLQEYGRHSKSIDVAAKACGVCNGALEFLGKFNADGTKAEEKKATAFSLFVKEHFGSVKERLPAGTPHKVVMQELSARWKSGGGTGKKTRAGDADAAGALEGMRALKLG